MKLTLPKLFSKSPKKEVKKADVKSSSDIPQMSTQTAIWVGTTLVFATLFFLSSVLDMKVHVSFGSGSDGNVTTRVAVPSGGSSQPSGIASQVGGC